MTKSLQPKKPALDTARRECIVSAFAYALKNERIYLRAFVVMPDHWHALLALREPWNLPRFMHSIMSFVAAKTGPCLKQFGTEWQDGYYETRVKTARQFAYMANYIEQNPVAKALVTEPGDWEASSAKRKELITEPWPWFFDSE